MIEFKTPFRRGSSCEKSLLHRASLSDVKSIWLDWKNKYSQTNIDWSFVTKKENAIWFKLHNPFQSLARKIAKFLINYQTHSIKQMMTKIFNIVTAWIATSYATNNNFLVGTRGENSNWFIALRYVAFFRYNFTLFWRHILSNNSHNTTPSIQSSDSTQDDWFHLTATMVTQARTQMNEAHKLRIVFF